MKLCQLTSVCSSEFLRLEFAVQNPHSDSVLSAKCCGRSSPSLFRTMTQHFWKSDYHTVFLLCVFNTTAGFHLQLALRALLKLMMSQGS